MLSVLQQLNEYKNINITQLHADYEGLIGSISAGDIVVYDKYQWKAVIDNPDTEPQEASPFWVKWAISNKYAALDEKGDTQSICNATSIIGGVGPFDMVMEFDWVGMDILVLSNIVASEIHIEIKKSTDTDYSTPVWDKVIDTSARTCVTNWYAYFNMARTCPNVDESKGFNILLRPPAVVGTIRITFKQSATSPESRAGVVFGGVSHYLGCTLFPVSLGLDDFSQHKADDYGTVVLVRRKSRRIRKLKTVVEAAEVVRIESYVKGNLLGRSVLFVGDETPDSIFGGLMILGFLDDFDANLTGYGKQQLDFSLVEII